MPSPPTTPRTKRTYLFVTPTKLAMASVMHNCCGMSFASICTQTPFCQSTIKPRALAKSMKRVAEHSGNFYYNGKKGACGRKKAVSDEQLEEAGGRLDNRELVDGEQV
ncbi:unnamed protein product [Mycena citricolor]|uniref:Uncharacterized protein n=1 Tax=Mycena citricolor TaxID=2018698 RepID=A0AAD2HWS1_9AGAR|nr:unnamed protein product [Mycena citricolor]